MSVEEKREAVFSKVTEKFGFVPNLFKKLAVSPAVAETYLAGIEALEGVSLTKQELQAVSLAAATEESCNYCKAAHTAMGKMVGLEPKEMELIKAGKEPEDERLRALVNAARLIHKKRGCLEADEVKGIEAQGVTRGELYEVIAIIANKTIATYVNHIAGTGIDPEFSAEA